MKFGMSVAILYFVSFSFQTRCHCFVKSLRLTEHHGMEKWGSEGITPLILNLSPRWRWVASFTPRPPYSRRKSPLGLIG